jgi:phosphate transport system substrate-binding protein
MMRNFIKYNGVFVFLCAFFFFSCSNYFKNDYNDNSPTSGKLKVYLDEGLKHHIKNQAYTFESIYPNANIYLYSSSENDAIQKLYNDSCELIVISRVLNKNEIKSFASKNYTIIPTPIAKSGIAIITSKKTLINKLSFEEAVRVLNGQNNLFDSLGSPISLRVVFDSPNSSVIHYLQDSALKNLKIGTNCSVLNSTLESINYVAHHKNSIAFIDFAWLSDSDDSIFKANESVLKILPLSKKNSRYFEKPNQSSFKLNTYPFTRTIYAIKKTGEFTLAKGFETFIAGPKGQLTFLKQGLLPNKQNERSIKIIIEP